MNEQKNFVEIQDTLFPNGKPEPEEFLKVIVKTCNEILNKQQPKK